MKRQNVIVVIATTLEKKVKRINKKHKKLKTMETTVTSLNIKAVQYQ